jgi:hypothetical protein
MAMNKETGMMIVNNQGIIKANNDKKSNIPIPLSVTNDINEEDLVNNIININMSVIERK